MDSTIECRNLHGEENTVWVVTHSGRERVVPHDFANTSFGIPVWPFCKSFFQGNVWFTRTPLGPRVTPIIKVQTKPSSVRRRPKDFQWMENAPCLFIFRKMLRESVCPFVPNGSKSKKWWEARWLVYKCFVKSAEVVSATTSPRSTIEITCNFLCCRRCSRFPLQFFDSLGGSQEDLASWSCADNPWEATLVHRSDGVVCSNIGALNPILPCALQIRNRRSHPTTGVLPACVRPRTADALRAVMTTMEQPFCATGMNHCRHSFMG